MDTEIDRNDKSKVKIEVKDSNTGIGHGDLAGLIGVKPDLAPPALENAGG